MPLRSLQTVSVVIPLFNKEYHVRQAIESVLAQSRDPEEILVIDDGSTDGSYRVVHEYAPSVSLISQPHRGVSAARNLGIGVAKGDLIAFLDADDFWKPFFLEKVAALFERFPQACAAGSGYELLTKPGQISHFRFAGIPTQSWQGIIDYFACIAVRGAPPLHASGVIASRAVLKQIGGFPVGARWGEDHDTWARLALAGDIAFTNEVLFTVNVVASNRASESRSPRPVLPAAGTILRALDTANNKRRAHLRKYLNVLIFNSATANLRFGHQSLARRQLVMHRKLTGLRVRWLGLMLCSFLPSWMIRAVSLLRKAIVA